MDISNVSCEYFYDEEYDIAINEGTYNNSFLNSFNNNNNNNFYQTQTNHNRDRSHFKHEFLTTSRLWSECLQETSGNNNYDESCDNTSSNIFKCASSDNVLDGSRYSLSKNLPFLNQTAENSINYRLYFDEKDTIGVKNVFDIRKQFAKKYNSKVFIDSGKCSAATSDSLILPFKYYRNELANSENNLHETSFEVETTEKSTVSQRKKSSKLLWRKLKNAFSSKKIKWKKTVNDNLPIKFCRSYSSPCLQSLNYSSNNNNNINSCDKNNRFSTTVVELYNLLSDLCNESNDTVFISANSCQSKYIQTSKSQAYDVSCQCPEIIPKKLGNAWKMRRNLNREYPGLGKIKLPHQLRTSIRHLIATDEAFENLKFLENICEVNEKDIKRSSSVNRIRGRSVELENVNSLNKMEKRKKSRPYERCASESRHKTTYNGNIQESNMQLQPNFITNSPEFIIMEESKSISFSDLRPIPKNWGLSNTNQILAVFEFPSRTSVEPKCIEYDEESSARIGGLVMNTIAAIKLVSANISNCQDLATICDKFVRCKDSNRQSTSALLVAVDNILALISDGLSIDSLRSKKGQSENVTGTKLTLRMWMFIEESCRSNLIKDVSHKLAFANLLKQVKQICGNTVPDQRSKEWLAQLKLQIFIVIAIKNNILHIWLRAVVVNDTILHRFFATCSFFQQARTSYSNALSAVVVEIRHLSTPSDSKIVNIDKAVKGGRGRSGGPQTVSNSSSDNSLSKSRIPRLNKKSSNVVVVPRR